MALAAKAFGKNAGSIIYRANKRKSLSSVFIGRLIIKCKNAKSVFIIKDLKQAITSQNLAYLMRIELIIIKITYYLLYIYYNSLAFKKEKFNLRINH
ncbi:hypothetical protein Taitung16_07540 [Helicobacter pylori]